MHNGLARGALALLFIVALPAAASADVTVGTTGTSVNSARTCDFWAPDGAATTCTVIGTQATATGTIRSLRIRHGSTFGRPTAIKVKVLQASGGSSYTVARASAPATISASVETTTPITGLSLAVTSGDYVGITVDQPSTTPANERLAFGADTGAFSGSGCDGDPAAGEGCPGLWQDTVNAHPLISVDIDTPPETTFTGGPSGPTREKRPVFTFRSSDSPSTFECRANGGSWVDCSPDPAGDAGGVTFVSDLADGDYTLEVRATDAFGNADPTAASRSFRVDTVAPNTTIESGPPSSSGSSSASFDLSASESGATFSCRLDGGTWTPCSDPATVSGLGDGSHSFEARARDAAGNEDETPAQHTWTVATAASAAPQAGGGGSDQSGRIPERLVGTTWEAQDPVDSVNGGPRSSDIERVTITYNAPSGAFNVVVRFHASVIGAAQDRVFLKFKDDAGCANGSDEVWFASHTRPSTTFNATARTIPTIVEGSKSIEDGGRELVLTLGDERAANLNLRCVIVGTFHHVLGEPPVFYDEVRFALGSNGGSEPVPPTLRSVLASLAEGFDGGNPAIFARRRTVPHVFAFPVAGRITYTWLVPASAARRAGARASARLVPIARGTATARVAGQRAVPVKLLPRGRRLLARARRAKITLSASFVPRRGRATASRASFTLRR